MSSHASACAGLLPCNGKTQAQVVIPLSWSAEHTLVKALMSRLPDHSCTQQDHKAQQGFDVGCSAQGEKDDKIIAVHADDPEFKGFTDISQLPPHRLQEIRRYVLLHIRS